MSFRDCLIVERPNDWLVVVGSDIERLASDVPSEDLINQVGRMASRAGIRTPRCVIAPTSNSCFFASLQVGPEINVRDRNSLKYELESHVPLDAEAMEADFILVSSSKRRHDKPSDQDSGSETPTTVSALAIEVRRWSDLVQSFEEANLVVRSIVPAAVLATRALCQGFDDSKSVELFLVDASRVDAVTIRGRTIVAWKHLALDPTLLRQHRLLDANDIDEVVVVGADSSQLEVIQDNYQGAVVNSIDRPLESCWTEGAELTLQKPSAGWFDLRRGALGPSDPLRPVLTQFRLVIAAAVFCLLAIVIGAWWRGRRIEEAIGQLAAQQRVAFEEAFPGKPVPAALLRRVRSEHAKVMGSRGASVEIDVPQSATEVLRELLTALPESIRFRITSLTIVNGQVDLDVQVRTTVDAGTIASSLESHGFEVQPPVTTRKDERTFDSVLEAKWNGQAPGASSNDQTRTQTSQDRGESVRLMLTQREPSR